jgi:hypothetical protein
MQTMKMRERDIKHGYNRGQASSDVDMEAVMDAVAADHK